MKHLSLALLALSLSGCGLSLSRPIEIQQGKVSVTPEIVESVKGLGTNDVRELLGPPHTRWNIDGLIWLYSFQNDSGEQVKKFSAELHFDNKGLIKEILISNEIAGHGS